MFNLSDKELDRLSREAADAYEVETNTSSWDALEKRLDQELGTAPKPNVPPPRRFIFPIAYTSLIILLVGSGYFLLKSSKKSNTENKTNYTLNNIENKKSADSNSYAAASASNTEKNIDAAINSASDKLNKDELATNDKKDKDASTTASLNDEKAYLAHLKTIAEKELEKKNGTALDKKGTDNTASANSNERKSESTASNHSNLIHNKNSKNHHDKKITNADELKNIANTELSENNVLASNNSKHSSLKEKGKNNLTSVADNNDNKIDNTKDLNNPENTNTASEEEYTKHASLQGTMLAAKHHKIIVSDSSLNAEAAKLQTALINLNKKNKSLNINRSLQIGLSFAPDFSKVKYVYENYHIGTSVGLTLSYQVLHKFSINSGVLYANKFYQASGEDFHQQQQQLSAALVNEHVEFVRGSFKMIEMPLNLRYDFSADGNTIFFINGGLSSYFILNQNNAYFCHDYVGAQRWIKENDGKNQNYLFSMLNLSLGFETFLSNNISLQIDPYIKFPLRNVGVGNVQLSSYGINIGVKYSPVLRRSRH